MAETVSTPLAAPESPYGKLTPAEHRIIVDKKTDPPFAGKYDTFFQPGLYACRQCGAPLYNADDKFDSGCGWPAFDDALPDAVRRVRDPDGKRMEISCARCGAHLGHVFEKENLTPNNTRYCVNSTSLVFEPADSPRLQRAFFAGGCFWGVEYWMKRQPGVLTVISGYTGGTTPYPTYRQVSSGSTGHAEAVEVVFDPRKTDYEKLCRAFLEIHDPTQLNRQGPDFGTQYRSAIFPVSDEQHRIAEKLLQTLRERGYRVQTRIEPFKRFRIAESYHRNYYDRQAEMPSCHNPVKRFGD